MASSEDWSAAQIARIATLEEELALKSEALRSQGDELASAWASAVEMGEVGQSPRAVQVEEDLD